MSRYTDNYNLILPEGTEHYDVSVANANNTSIDNILKNKVNAVTGQGLSECNFTVEYKRKLDSLQKIYKLMGSVESYDDLLAIDDNTIGDIWNVIEENTDYCWDGEGWFELGDTFDVNDMATKEEVNAVDNAKVNKTINVTTAGTDLNNYTDEGRYFFSNANTPSNKPSNVSANAGYLEVIRRGSSDVIQIWYAYNRKGIFTRQMTESTWRDWYRIQTGTEYIQCGLNADYTVQANNTAETLPFKTIISQSGNKLSVNSSSEIVIGAGVSKIRVTGQAYFYTGTTGAKTLNIIKNTGLAYRSVPAAPYQYVTISIPTTIIDVAQNDKIKIEYSGKASDLIKAYNSNTFLLVEAID